MEREVRPRACHKEMLNACYLLQFILPLTMCVIVHSLFYTVLMIFSNTFSWVSPSVQTCHPTKGHWAWTLNSHLAPLLLTNDWVSLDINCEPLSLIINVSTHLDAKNLFNRQTHDGDEKPGTKSRYMRLLKVQVNKAIQQLNVCNLP